MNMSKVQYNRTKILIEELKTLRANTPKPKFRMANWMSEFLTKMFHKKDLHQAIMDATREPCGTACCLAGKAGLIPRIRRLGFKWDVLDGGSAWSDAKANFQYKDEIGNEAVKLFFGSYLFCRVFMNTEGLRTLLQGIKALQDAVNVYDDEQSYLNA